jgi:hypothetical protein
MLSVEVRPGTSSTAARPGTAEATASRKVARLGFVAPLKLFEIESRFPHYVAEVPRPQRAWHLPGSTLR